ncbi:hypothetical protein Hanom_Chr08g00703901 [Helianthus anomalus]
MVTLSSNLKKKSYQLTVCRCGLVTSAAAGSTGAWLTPRQRLDKPGVMQVRDETCRLPAKKRYWIINYCCVVLCWGSFKTKQNKTQKE